MSLSIKKLEKFLSKNGFLTRMFFTIGGMCCYIDAVSILNSESFLIYIPSRYDIEINEGTTVFKIEEIELLDSNNIADSYGGEQDNLKLSQLYNEIELELSNANKSKEISTTLENNYNSTLSLEEPTHIIHKELRELSRQIKRLKLCLQNVKYKTAIIYKTFLCILKRDDSIECYNILKYKKTNNRRLYIVTDLEFLYQNINSIQEDLPIIYNSMYQVLDKNQETHDLKLYKMLEEYNKLTESSNVILNIKREYSLHFTNFKNLLIQISQNEFLKIEEIENIAIKYNGLSSLNSDIQKTHHIGKLEKDLEDIKNIKQTVITNLIKIREKRENILLLVDNIMFDNIIMLNQIKQNCNKLKEINN